MPNNIVKTLADKTGKSVEAVEDMWDKAKEEVLKHTHEGDKKFYPTVVFVLKKMLHINESGEVELDEDVAGTLAGNIATVPQRLGGKPQTQALFDSEHNGIPVFNVDVDDYLSAAGSKRMGKKIVLKNEKVHQHIKNGNNQPFIIKYLDNHLKITRKDYGI
jgi:hypothetical protein